MAFSQYPPTYQVKASLQQVLDSGALSPSQVLAELYSVADSVNQAIEFIKTGFAADRRLKPATLHATVNVDVQRFTATAGQTEFLFLNSVTVDPATATVGAFSDGVRIDPNDVTISTDRVALPAQTAGAVVLLEIHDNAESVFANLASTATSLGASLVGLEDAFGNFAAANVEDALSEVAESLTALETALGSLDAYLLRDGSRAWTGNQNGGGYRLTNLAAGVNGSDAATVNQVNAVIGGGVLSLLGGTMQGAIDMDGFKITDLATGTAAGDAIRRDQAVLRDGSQVMAGTLDMNSNPITSATYVRLNLDPSDPYHAARKSYVDDAIDDAPKTSQRTITTAGAFSGTIPDGCSVARVLLVGGGGGGGGGGSHGTDKGAGGGGGGGAGGVRQLILEVTPGASYSGTVGAGGAGGLAGTSGSDNATAGDDGGNTSIIIAGSSHSVEGGQGGSPGARVTAGGAGGEFGEGLGCAYVDGYSGGAGGDGGLDSSNVDPTAGAPGGAIPGGYGRPGNGGAVYASNAEDCGGGGGGGGAPPVPYTLFFFPSGGNGGGGADQDGTPEATAGSAGSYGGGGGGGGGGADRSSLLGKDGGAGGDGFVHIVWEV